MMLEVCNNNFLFFIEHFDKIDVLCYFIILLCILLCMVVKNIEIQKENNNLISKIAIVIASVMFIIFMFVSCALAFNKIDYEGCYCEPILSKKMIDSNKYEMEPVSDIVYNKVIVVGDSRMEYIERDKDDLQIPINFSFIAKSGATIHWFEDVALPELKEKLDNADKNYNYHVVINMGVNDFQEDIDIDERVYDYFNFYKELSLDYPNINFYLLSVNPVVDDKINDYFPTNKRSNKKIIKFNNKMNKLLNGHGIENLIGCDSYHDIKFIAPDGLHYNLDTDQDILDYIAKECIIYA